MDEEMEWKAEHLQLVPVPITGMDPPERATEVAISCDTRLMAIEVGV